MKDLLDQAQIVRDSAGRPTHAIVPIDVWEILCDSVKSDEDLAAEAVDDATLPPEVWARLEDGENPIKVIREYRGLTRPALAELVGLNAQYLYQIESGRRTGTMRKLAAIAECLDVPLEMIVGQTDSSAIQGDIENRLRAS